MIKLSERLQLIAQQIKKGQTMADIGTDHGFLPIYLVQSQVCPKVILADISKDSLQKSIDNVASLMESCDKAEIDKFEFRCGSGLEVLKEGEVDVICIAGMGGILMSEILDTKPEKTASFQHYIFQPRIASGKLRHYLYHNNFTVNKELLVREGKFICETIVASYTPTAKIEDINYASDHVFWEVPERLIGDNGQLGLEFVHRKLKTEKKNLESVTKGKNSISAERAACISERVDYLKKLISQFE